MTISDLIESLEQKRNELGDVKVFVDDSEYDSVEVIGVHSSCIVQDGKIYTNPQVLLVT